MWAVGGPLEKPFRWYPGMEGPRYSHAARVEADLALLRLEPIFLALRRQWENLVHKRIGQVHTLGFAWRAFQHDEGLVYRRWFYTRGCPGCDDFTPTGNLCRCDLGLESSIPRTAP